MLEPGAFPRHHRLRHWLFALDLVAADVLVSILMLRDDDKSLVYAREITSKVSHSQLSCKLACGGVGAMLFKELGLAQTVISATALETPRSMVATFKPTSCTMPIISPLIPPSF